MNSLKVGNPENLRSKPKLGIPNYLCIPTSQKHVANYDQSEFDQKSVHSQGSGIQLYRNLDNEQVKSIDNFMNEVDSLVSNTISKTNKDPKLDEDLILLITLKQFVARYFGSVGSFSPSQDHIARLMREKVKINDMLLVLSSIKFKDKHSDMILVTVKQFDDIFLELIINPNTFKAGQINFYRGGKNIVNTFIFLIKNIFQQIRVLKSIYYEEFLHADVLHLFSNHSYIELLKSLINTILEIAALETTSSPPLVVNAPTSAFQLHSQKHSQDMAQQHQNDHHEDTANQSQNFLEKVFNSGTNLNIKPAPKIKKEPQYSFEFGLPRDFMGSGKHSPVKDDPRELGGHNDPENMNIVISNLLRSKPSNNYQFGFSKK